jgi:hypothetical protein
MALRTIWRVDNGDPLTLEGVDAKDYLRSGVYTDVDPQGGTSPDITEKTGTTYTLQLADAFDFIDFNNAAAITVTVPKNVFDIGTVVSLYQKGAGAVTVVGATGVTIKVGESFAATTKEIDSLIQIIQRSRNLWSVFGALADAA